MVGTLSLCPPYASGTNLGRNAPQNREITSRHRTRKRVIEYSRDGSD
jgi:hypothetical protein